MSSNQNYKSFPSQSAKNSFFNKYCGKHSLHFKIFKATDKPHRWQTVFIPARSNVCIYRSRQFISGTVEILPKKEQHKVWTDQMGNQKSIKIHLTTGNQSCSVTSRHVNIKGGV